MKKFIFILAIIGSLLITSCTEGLIPEPAGFKRDAFVNKDRITQMHEYDTLSSEVKNYLWQYKMHDNLSLPYISRKDKRLIRQIKTKMQPSLWERPMSEEDSIAMHNFETMLKKTGWSLEKKYLLFETYLTIDELNAQDYLINQSHNYLSGVSPEEMLLIRHFLSEHLISTSEDHYSLDTLSPKESGLNRQLLKKLLPVVESYRVSEYPDKDTVIDSILREVI